MWPYNSCKGIQLAVKILLTIDHFRRAAAHLAVNKIQSTPTGPAEFVCLFCFYFHVRGFGFSCFFFNALYLIFYYDLFAKRRCFCCWLFSILMGSLIFQMCLDACINRIKPNAFIYIYASVRDHFIEAAMCVGSKKVL